MDMLIKLYPTDAFAHTPPESSAGSTLRKPIGPEHTAITDWVAAHFGASWASEAQVALSNRPVTVWLAIRGPELLGFACYDATARGFVGPIGVREAARGQGVGAALLRACLHDMRSAGYGYAVAGSVGPAEFFAQVGGAIEIPDSTPGLYAGRLAP
jgi:GNAT superfamily N-acetyltransferase